MSGKKFQFSLASVLKLRTHEAEGARQVLVDLMQKRDRQHEAATQLRGELDAVVQSRSTGATGQRALSRHEAFRAEAQRRLDEAVRMLDYLDERIHEARIQLMERKSAEEALKQLRNDEQARCIQENRAAETQFLDDQAISSYQRQRRASNT